MRFVYHEFVASRKQTKGRGISRIIKPIEDILWLIFLPAVLLSISAGQAVAVLLFALRLTRRERFHPLPGFLRPTLAFLGWAVLTALVADPGRWTDMLSKWWVILVAALVYDRARSTGGFPRMLLAVFITAVALFPFEIWGFFGTSAGRAMAFSGGAPSLGSNLMMLSIICFALAGMARGRTKLAAGAFFIILLAGLVMSVNRAALLGAAVALGWMAFRRLPALVPAALLVLGTFMAVAPESSITWRLRGIVRPYTSPTSEERLHMWTSGMKMVRDQPMTGFATRRGFMENYGTRYRHPRALEAGPGHVHNSFIQTAVLHGVPGLGLLLWLLAIVWRNLRRASRAAAADPWRAAAAASTLPLLLAVLVNSFFDFVPAEGQRALMFWALVGLLPGFLFSKIPVTKKLRSPF